MIGPMHTTVERVLIAAKQTMEAAGVNCLLTTLDTSGCPRARIMAAVDAGPDMSLWFVTNPATRKVEQIRKDRRAMVAWYDAKGQGYLTLNGEISFVDDPNEKQHHWREEMRVFFPGGPDTKDFMVLKFVPSHLELLSFSLGIATTPFAWRPVVLVRADAGWLIGDRAGSET